MRGQNYTSAKKQKKVILKIGKNRHDRTHACLIPWEELPELDLREQAVTGIDPDYPEMDRHTIQLIPELLV